MDTDALDAATLTVAEAFADPPTPVHVRVKVVAAVIGPVDWLPLVAFVPVQPPVAEHVVAFVLVQLRVEATPLATLVGFAVSVIEGAGLGVTVTVTDRAIVPPLPEQLRVKMLVDESALVFCEPLSVVVPLQAPEAAHVVALVDAQERVVDAPLETVVGFAVNDSVGGGATVTVTDRLVLPPAPVQVKAYVWVAVSGPVDVLPVIAFDPLQAPEAVQPEAFEELH